MGVEYQHFLVVNDPVWRSQPDTAARVMAVMQGYGLVRSLQFATDLSPGKFRKIDNPSISMETGHGIAFWFEQGNAQTIANICQPDWFESDEIHDYFEHDYFEIALVIGDDYRLLPSSEDVVFEIVEPATINGNAVQMVKFRPGEHWPWLPIYDAFPYTEGANPPKVKVHGIENNDLFGWQHCEGFCRGAIALDLQKLWLANDEGRLKLHAKEFVKAVEEAFRGPVIEYGYWC